MLATLTRVKSARWLSPDILLGHMLRQEVRGRNELSPLGLGSCLQVWRRKVAGGVRDVSTSCTLCAKGRGNPNKTEKLSEKKLVCV